MRLNTSVLATSLPFLTLFFILGLFSPNFLKRDSYFGSILPEHLKNTDEIRAVGKFYKKIYLAICGPYTIVFAIFLLFNDNSKYFTNGLIIFSVIWIAIYFKTHTKVQKVIESNLKVKANGTKKNTSYTKNYASKTSLSKEKVIASPAWFLVPVFIIVLDIIFSIKYYNSIPENMIFAWNFKGKAILTMHKGMDIILIYPIIQLVITSLCQHFYKSFGSIMDISKDNKVFLTGFVEFINIYLVILTSVSFYKSLNILNISTRIIPGIYVFTLVFVPLTMLFTYKRINN